MKREGSVAAWSQCLHTNMGPRHRCSIVSREKTLVRHSCVSSAHAGDANDDSDDGSAISSVFRNKRLDRSWKKRYIDLK